MKRPAVTPQRVLAVVAIILAGFGIVGLFSQSDEQELLAALATAKPYPGAVAVSVQDQASRVRRVYATNASPRSISSYYADALPKDGWHVVTNSTQAETGLCAERGRVRLHLTYSTLTPPSNTYVVELIKNATCEQISDRVWSSGLG